MHALVRCSRLGWSQEPSFYTDQQAYVLRINALVLGPCNSRAWQLTALPKARATEDMLGGDWRPKAAGGGMWQDAMCGSGRQVVVDNAMSGWRRRYRLHVPVQTRAPDKNFNGYSQSVV